MNGSPGGTIDGEVTEVTFWKGVALSQADIDNLYGARYKQIALQVEGSSIERHFPMDEKPNGTSINGVTFFDLSGTGNRPRS